MHQKMSGKMRPEKKSRGGRTADTGAAASTSGASRHQIVFNKDFGQHILKNPLVVDAIVEKVRDVDPSYNDDPCLSQPPCSPCGPRRACGPWTRSWKLVPARAT